MKTEVCLKYLENDYRQLTKTQMFEKGLVDVQKLTLIMIKLRHTKQNPKATKTNFRMKTSTSSFYGKLPGLI